MHCKLHTYIVFIFLTIAVLGGCKQNGIKTGALVYSDGSPGFNRVIDKATQLHDSGFTEKAIKYLDSNFVVNPPNDAIDIFHYYLFFFDHYSRIESRNPKKAELYSDSMIRILEQQDLQKVHIKQYAQAVFSKGDALFKERKYTEAYKYFYQAKALIIDNVDPCALAGYSYRLGMVLYKQDRYQEAAYYFHEAYGEFGSCDFDFSAFYRQQELLDNIGLSFSKAGMQDSAMSYFSKALTYIADNFVKFPTKPTAFRDKANAVVYGNMALVYSSKGDEKTAIELLNKSISINQQKGYDPFDAQLNRLKLAAVYYKQNDIPHLKSTLLTVQQINDTMPDQGVQIGFYDMMWKYAVMTHDINNSFAYLLKYHYLKDSIDIQMKGLRETDLNEQVKNLDKQYQISILEKNNELKKTYLVLALLGAIMTALVFLLLFNNWQKTKRNVKALTYLHTQVSVQKVELEQLLKKLEETHRDKDRVLRAVAHDIRNPIAAIASLADLLTAGDHHYDDEQIELLNYIKNSCTDALSLTREILEAADPSKAEAMVKEDVDVKKMLKDYVELLRFKAAEKQQQINMQLPDGPVHAMINKEKIWRVVSNLVTNAIKFSPERSVIEVVVILKNAQINISVHDMGIGIPDSIKDKVFDMFTEAKRPGTGGEKPFGLGLSISKQIVDAHYGKIWFETNEHNGSTFYVTIPVDAMQTGNT